MVQAGAYSHLDKAEGVRTKAAAQGQRCVISPAETSKGTLYRLRCGPYADRTQAQAAIKSLTAAGIAAQIVAGAR
jgi:DedD protein